jgi:hypothetical protein
VITSIFAWAFHFLSEFQNFPLLDRGTFACNSYFLVLLKPSLHYYLVEQLQLMNGNFEIRLSSRLETKI